MGSLLKTALEKRRYDLAAHILVFGLIKAKYDDKKRHAKRKKERILRSGA
jgi:hypothetical protein